MDSESPSSPPVQQAVPSPRPASHRSAEEPMPAPVRTVLLIGVAASIAALGLLGVLHLWQNPGAPIRSGGSDPQPSRPPLRSTSG